MLAEAYHLLGQHDEVERVVTDALQHELTDTQRSVLSRRLARTRFSSQRDLAGALAALDEACAVVRDPDELGLIQGRRALLLADAGRPADALEVLDTIVVQQDAAANVELATARAVSLLSVGRHAEAAEMSRRAAELQTTLSGWQARRGMSGHLVNEAHALAYSGRYAEARRLVEPAAEQARSANAMAASVWLEMTLAEIARDTGRADEAIRRFSAVAGEAASSGQDAAIVWAHVGVAQGHLLLGECGPAADALARADAAGDSPIATSWATRERTRAWLEAGLGDLAAARARLREVVTVVQRDGVRTFEVGVAQRPRPLRPRRRRPSTVWASSSRWWTDRWCAPTTATPSPSPRATPTRCARWSTTTKRSTCSTSPPRRPPSWPSCTSSAAMPGSPPRRCSVAASSRRAPAGCARHRSPVAPAWSH